MKLIEVVVLLGAQCISPVQHTGTATEAAKVQCAVVIEKDTEANTLRIVPAGASNKPEVVAVLERLDDAAPAVTPAAASPPQAQAATSAIAPPPDPAASAPAQVKAEDSAPPPAAAEAPKQKQKQASKVPEKARPAASKAPSQEAKADVTSKCRGAAKPKWYTNAEGRRKYRCVVPG